jgi:glutamate formiminotransferase
MPPLVECVPNFSEGRAGDVVEAIATALRAVPGAHLLDVHVDRWHHRSVFSVAGTADAVLDAAFRATLVARDRIDLTRHRGEHPRIGAADVIPFVPLAGTPMEECVELARRLGGRVGDELGIPVFLYGDAATRPDRVNLADLRRGGFEGLRETMGKDPSRAPDFGPPAVHSTAGAAAVGARPVLVAFNAYLDTDDVVVARGIAAAVRSRGGGLPAVRALGMLVDGKAQVSTNLLDVDRTSPARLFQAVRHEAERRGVRVTRSEIVGLCPERALSEADGAAISLVGDRHSRLLERALARAGLAG